MSYFSRRFVIAPRKSFKALKSTIGHPKKLTGQELNGLVAEPRDTVRVRKGYFPESAKGLEGNTFALVSLDLDTYEGILAGWEFFYPRLSRGGYIFVHDFNAMEYDRGPFRATTAFLSDKPEMIVEIPDQWGSALIRKS